jgi:hypothetical protein
MSKILAAYSEAGYPAKTLAILERIYSRSSMKLLEPSRYQRSWKRLLTQATVMKWLIPTLLLGLGGITPTVVASELTHHYNAITMAATA